MLKTERVGKVAVLTNDRPERRNALGSALMDALAAALHAADSDDDVGAIVVTAAPPAFCAGSDLKELAGLSIEDMCTHEAATAAVARGIARLSKPVIAAVDGYALGGGMILALSCDIVVTTADARWHMPEVGNGWLPPWGLQALLARVGPVRARLMTWGVTPINGVEAHRIGVADYLAVPGQTLDQALTLAAALAAMPRASVRSVKRFFEPFVVLDGEHLDAMASRGFAADCRAPEARETFNRFGVKQ